MTDIASSNAPTARPRFDKQPNMPTPGIGASLAAIARLAAAAFTMAYLDPYASHGGRPEVVPDDDLEGRDPSW